MLKKLLLGVMATLVLVGSTFGFQSPPVQAAPAPFWDDPEHPLYTGAEWIDNECHDIPTELWGMASGSVTAGTLHQQQPVASGSPPTTIPRTYKDTAFAARTIDSNEWVRWQNMANLDVPDTLTVPATPPATGTVAAPVGSDEYMRALLGSDWWDDFKAARNIPAGTVARPTVLEAKQVKDGTFRGYPRLPMSTVGGSGASVIETTGTVKVGTDNSKAVVTPARVAGTGISAMTGSAPSLVAATFLGGLCGTINGLPALGRLAGVFDDPWARYDGPPQQYETEPMVACSGVGYPSGTSGTDRCVKVIRAGLGFSQVGAAILFNPPEANLGSLQSHRQSNGSVGTGRKSVGSSGDAYLGLPCVTPANNCGLTPFGFGYPGWPTAFGIGGTVVVLFNGTGNTFRGYGLIDPEGQSHGYRRRLKTTASCQNPDGIGVAVRLEWSDPFWDDEPTPDWPLNMCRTGEAPVALKLERETLTGGSSTPATWGSPSTALDWEIDPRVRASRDTLRCFMVGATSCPRVDTDPGNPEAPELIGGPEGVPVPKGAPGTSDVLGEVIESLDPPAVRPDDGLDPDPEPEPDPDPDPDDPGGPTSDPCSGGVPAGTGGCGTPPTSEDPPETSGGECFPSGWGWLNPVEWVLKPVKCALVWAFWDADAADEMGDLVGDTGWPDAVAESSFTTSTAAGPCIDMDVAEICTQPILEHEAPNYVAVLVAAVVSFFGLFEVIGLFARITGG